MKIRATDKNVGLEIVFNQGLGNDAYRDLLLQIDPTVLMSAEEKDAHMEKCNLLAKEILDEIIAKENLQNR